MTMFPTSDAALVQVSDLRYRAVQSQMSNLLQHERALRQNLAQLHKQKQAGFAQSATGDLAAAMAGVDLRWHQWIDQRQTAINLELARVLAQQAELRGKLTTAFGKMQVAQALAQKAVEKRRQIKARREGYES